MSARGQGLPGRLLVDLPNWVGDVVMALPAVHRLLEANQGGATCLYARPAVVRLLRMLFPGADVISSARHARLLPAARTVRRRNGRFDVGLTLRNSPRARLLLLLAARRRIGSAGGWGGGLLTDPVNIPRLGHQVEDPRPMLARLGIAVRDLHWLPEVPDVLREEGARALADAGAAAATTALIPTALWGPSKRWPNAAYGELARALVAAGRPPVLLVGPGEEDAAREVSAVAGHDLTVIGPDLDIAGLLGVLTRLEVVVSNDTGPMHLAAMAGCRVVALFGPTDPRRTAPLGEGHTLLFRGLDCSPCLAPVCPLGHHRCLRDIPAEEVQAAMLG